MAIDDIWLLAFLCVCFKFVIEKTWSIFPYLHVGTHVCYTQLGDRSILFRDWIISNNLSKLWAHHLVPTHTSHLMNCRCAKGQGIWYSSLRGLISIWESVGAPPDPCSEMCVVPLQMPSAVQACSLLATALDLGPIRLISHSDDQNYSVGSGDGGGSLPVW